MSDPPFQETKGALSISFLSGEDHCGQTLALATKNRANDGDFTMSLLS